MRNILPLLFCLFCFSTIYAETKQDSIRIINQVDVNQSYVIDTDTANKPEENYSDFTYTPPISRFNIPVEIDLQSVQLNINKTLSGLIYEDKIIEDDSLKLKVWKNGDFKINFEGDSLTAEIPIKIWAVKRFGIAGFTYTDREVDAQITVTLSSKLQISKSWGIISKSKVVNYKWNRKPTTRVAGFEIPITYIVDKVISDNKRNLELMVDNGIKNGVPTQNYAKDLWAQIQQPIPVAVDSYQAYIRLRPTNILMVPIRGEQGKIKTGFGIECQVDITVGSIPTRNGDMPLPQCRLNSRMEPGWNLNLLANIPYTTIDTLAMQNLKGEAFGDGKHTIYVDNVKTYGSDDKLAIGLTVHGFINGNIYLTGVPYYDQKDVAIKLKDVSYSLKTRNILHRAINLVIKPILKNKIEKKFELGMKDNFYLIEQMGQAEILNSQWAENVYTTGKITNVEGGDIYITKTGVQAALRIDGILNVLYK